MLLCRASSPTQAASFFSKQSTSAPGNCFNLVQPGSVCGRRKGKKKNREEVLHHRWHVEMCAPLMSIFVDFSFALFPLSNSYTIHAKEATYSRLDNRRAYKGFYFPQYRNSRSSSEWTDHPSGYRYGLVSQHRPSGCGARKKKCNFSSHVCLAMKMAFYNRSPYSLHPALCGAKPLKMRGYF